MTPRDIAIHRIEAELSQIPASLTPTEVAGRACMAAFLSCELLAITTLERDALLKRIRAAEFTRFLELLEKAA